MSVAAAWITSTLCKANSFRLAPYARVRTQMSSYDGEGGIPGGAGTLAGTMRVQRGGKKRLDVYLEPELYDWIHTQATRQRRSMSSFLGWVVAQLRDGLTVPVDGGTLTAAPPHKEEK